MKYADLDEMSKAIFDRANYPKWFFYVIATLEFAGGILILMTATASRRLGNTIIGSVMLGAIFTHLILKDNFSHFVLPSIILLISILTSVKFKKGRPGF